MKNYKAWLVPPVLFPLMMIVAIVAYSVLRPAI